MTTEISDYLKSQRVGVLALEMLDGSPHASTVHFAHSDDPFIFYFETDKNYRKSEPLFGKDITRASLVVGSDESSMKTLQLDGTVQLLKPAEKATFDAIYFGKFLDKKGRYTGPNVVLFTFIPTWWRFTDWTTPQGKKIWLSKP